MPLVYDEGGLNLDRSTAERRRVFSLPVHLHSSPVRMNDGGGEEEEDISAENRHKRTAFSSELRRLKRGRGRKT